MGAIDIGSGAANYNSTLEDSYTYIDLGNPANDTGTLTQFQTYFKSDGSNFVMGTFDETGTDEYDDRDYETIGSVASKSLQTFSGLDCDVQSGDFIGCYFTAGQLEFASVGSEGYCNVLGSQFGAGATTYTCSGSGTCALYGTGASPGWSNIAEVNTTLDENIAEVNTVLQANIAEVNTSPV